LNRNNTLFAAALMTAVTLFWASRPSKSLSAYRIAISDDAAGLLISEVSEKYAVNVSGEAGASFLRLADCCGVQAEIFLSGGDFDMAVLCPDAAKAFLENDPGVEILGGIVKRSNVLLYKRGGILKNIGYSNGKNTQAEAASRSLGGEIVLIPMTRTALLYALERGAADGVVIDILDALKAGSAFKMKFLEYDKITSVLVVKKNLRNTEAFKNFLGVLNQCARELNGAKAEAALSGRIEGESMGEMMEIWRNSRVTYIEIPNEE
jgi:hypothetical protein